MIPGPRIVMVAIAGLAVAALIAWGVAWVTGKDRAIRTAQTQRTAAVLFAVRGQNDGIMLRVNVSTVRAAIDRQNASVAALGVERDRTVAALAAAAQRSQAATVAANRRAAALLAGRSSGDPCRSALEVARSLP